MKRLSFHTCIAGGAVLALLVLVQPVWATTAVPAPKPPVAEEVAPPVTGSVAGSVTAPVTGQASASPAASPAPVAAPVAAPLPGMENLPQVDCAKEQGKLPYYINELLKGSEAFRRNHAALCLARALAAISGQPVVEPEIPAPVKADVKTDLKTDDQQKTKPKTKDKN